MTAQNKFYPVALGNFAIEFNSLENEFIITNLKGAPISRSLSVDVNNVYEIQRWAVLDSLKDVEDVTDPEIALMYVRQTIDLPDFDSYIPEAFQCLQEDDRNYCYLLCCVFALNRLYA